jgi:hypothetical protein
MASDASSVLAAVRERAVRQIAADAQWVDRNRAFPEAGLRALAATGGYGLMVPESAAWTSPPFHHCNFTTLDSSTVGHDAFSTLLLSMDAADAALCEAMRLENVNRWVEGDESGYADLVEAVRWRAS